MDFELANFGSHSLCPESSSVNIMNLATEFTTIPEISNFSWVLFLLARPVYCNSNIYGDPIIQLVTKSSAQVFLVLCSTVQ